MLESINIPVTTEAALSIEFPNDDELEEPQGLPSTCLICEKSFTDPVILNCLHIFDRECLLTYEHHDGIAEYIKCPKCEQTSGGLRTLEPFCSAVIDGSTTVLDSESQQAVQCSLCTEGREAQFRCIQCAGTLCDRCKEFHKVTLYLFFI